MDVVIAVELAVAIWWLRRIAINAGHTDLFLRLYQRFAMWRKRR